MSVATPAIRARFNPFSQSYYQDPYAALHRIREEDPVHWAFFNMWVVTRYDDIVDLLKDRDSFSADHVREWSGYSPYRQVATGESAFVRVEKGFVVFNEGAEHARLRAAMKPAFSSEAIRRLREVVTTTANRLLDEAVARGTGTFDLLADVARPLATRTMGKLLGVAEEHERRLDAWAHAYNMAIEPIAGKDVLLAADRATTELEALFLAGHETEGLGSTSMRAVLAAAERAGQVTRDEAFALWATVVLAGNATTFNAICNGMLALLRQPEQLATLRAQPELTKNAVNEMLRFDSPGMVVTRAAARGAALGGQHIRKGQLVLAFLGAANRDPAVFTQPDRLDVGRVNASRNIAFGQGGHFCMGEQIARFEIETVVRLLLDRLPRLRLATSDVQWVPKVHWRGLRALPVQV
ncbi:MAG: cytochrome P450 [Burkholderiaceae bacterium]